MKRTLFLLCPAVLLTVAVGCDEATLSSLPPDVQAMVSSMGGLDLKFDLTSQNNGDSGYGDQDRDRLRDGSCLVDGSLYQSSGGYGGGESGGNGDMLQLRDGSCDDGG